MQIRIFVIFSYPYNISGDRTYIMATMTVSLPDTMKDWVRKFVIAHPQIRGCV